MDNETYRLTQDLLLGQAKLFEQLDLDGFLARIRAAEGTGSFLYITEPARRLGSVGPSRRAPWRGAAVGPGKRGALRGRSDRPRRCRSARGRWGLSELAADKHMRLNYRQAAVRHECTRVGAEVPAPRGLRSLQGGSTGEA